MINYLAQTVVLFTIFLISIHPAAAQTREAKVKDAYTAYKIALAQKNVKLAAEHAYDAWKGSDEIFGGTKTTGDLAYNYASIAASLPKGKKSKIRDAYRQSTIISSQLGDNDATLKRYREHVLYLGKTSQKKHIKTVITDAKAFLAGGDFSKNIEAARFLVDIGNVEFALEHYDSAETLIDKALAAYEQAGKLDTEDGYTVLYSKARIAYKREHYIEAAEIFQKIFLNADDILSQDHVIIGRSFLLSRLAASKGGYWGDDNFDKEGPICRTCWPNSKKDNFQTGQGKQAKPIRRPPPELPSAADRSALVVFRHDINAQGVPVNIKTYYASGPSLFREAAETALSQWRYDMSNVSTADKTEKAHFSTISFHLTGFGGSLLDFNGNPIALY